MLKNMSYMFSYCRSLTYIPDISKWDTSNLENKDYMFEGCNKLVNIPKIERKNKGFFGALFGY